MTGISRHTGKPINNLMSAYQGVEVTLSTRLGSRLMRREFAGGVVQILGRLVTPALFAAYKQLVATSIDIWEPRFRVRRITVNGTVDELRGGKTGMKIEVDYRPRGHLGDLTVENVRQFTLFFGPTDVRVVA